jgi:hypothetical protein
VFTVKHTNPNLFFSILFLMLISCSLKNDVLSCTTFYFIFLVRSISKELLEKFAADRLVQHVTVIS